MDPPMEIPGSSEFDQAVDRLVEAARGVVRKLAEVGEQTSWFDGFDTDRVYSWGELADLREALEYFGTLPQPPRMSNPWPPGEVYD
jgi:hypothetical protein